MKRRKKMEKIELRVEDVREIRKFKKQHPEMREVMEGHAVCQLFLDEVWDKLEILEDEEVAGRLSAIAADAPKLLGIFCL